MIYVDTSVVLAQLLAEDRIPDAKLWRGPIVSSRLLAYEVWTRIHARGLGRTHAEDVRMMLGRVSFIELSPPVLGRALEPFPVSVRTLDALHLASMDFLRAQGQNISVAAYDHRLGRAAEAMGFELAEA